MLKMRVMTEATRMMIIIFGLHYYAVSVMGSVLY